MADQYTVTVRLQGQNQLTPAVGQATQSLRGLTQEAGRTNAAMNQLKTIGMGLFAGVSAAGVARMAEELYTTGMAAQRAGNLFRSFGAQIGDTDAVLARMRETTRGVVKDVDLMNAANSMLSMGLAKNAEDVQRLTDIGVTFAQAMGQDVGASLENLNMILANQSYLRLDTLGISSSQVRELAAQYRAAGMDSSEAFTAAFLEVAEGKLPQMAAVADATVTELQKLQTSMDNWWADFGNRFAQGVNGLIGIATHGGQAIQAALFGNESVWAGNIAAGAPGASAAAGVYADLFAASGQSAGALSGQNIQGALAAAIMAKQAGIDMGNPAFMEVLARQTFGVGANDALLRTDSGQMMLQQAASVVSWFNQYTAIVDEARAGVSQIGGVSRSATARPGFAAGDFADISMGSMYSAYIMSAERQAQQLQTLLGGASMVGGLQIISPESARDAENMAYAIEQIVDHLAGAGLEESFLAPLRAAAEQSRAGADAAAEWAKNLESASLSQLFGQTSGGRLGEIDAAVLGAMQAGGASDATMEAMRTALGMNSGQLTDLSVQFERDVVPMLADIGAQFGADALIAARTAYEQAIQDAALTGQTGPVDLAAVLGYAYTMPGTGGGGSFTVNPGDTPGAVAARTGMTVDQVLAATGAANAYSMPVGTFGSPGGDLVQIMQDAADNVAEAADNATGITDEMTTATETLQTGLDTAFGKQYRVEMALDVTDINVTPAFKNALTQVVAEIVRAQGGTTPGQSGGGGRSTRTSD